MGFNWDGFLEGLTKTGQMLTSVAMDNYQRAEQAKVAMAAAQKQHEYAMAQNAAVEEARRKAAKDAFDMAHSPEALKYETEKDAAEKNNQWGKESDARTFLSPEIKAEVQRGAIPAFKPDYVKNSPLASSLRAEPGSPTGLAFEKDKPLDLTSGKTFGILNDIINKSKAVAPALAEVQGGKQLTPERIAQLEAVRPGIGSTMAGASEQNRRAKVKEEIDLSSARTNDAYRDSVAQNQKETVEQRRIDNMNKELTDIALRKAAYMGSADGMAVERMNPEKYKATLGEFDKAIADVIKRSSGSATAGTGGQSVAEKEEPITRTFDGVKYTFQPGVPQEVTVKGKKYTYTLKNGKLI